MKYFLSLLFVLSLVLPELVFAGGSDYRKSIGGEEDSSNSQGYGGSPSARHQSESNIIINGGEVDERRQFEDQWGYHHKEDHKFQGFGEKRKKQSRPPLVITPDGHSAIDTETGEAVPVFPSGGH